MGRRARKRARAAQRPTDAPGSILVHRVPVLDTGLGIEAGYADDRELIDAHAAQRAALHPDVRAALDRLDREADHRFLFGDDGLSTATVGRVDALGNGPAGDADPRGC